MASNLLEESEQSCVLVRVTEDQRPHKNPETETKNDPHPHIERIPQRLQTSRGAFSCKFEDTADVGCWLWSALRFWRWESLSWRARRVRGSGRLRDLRHIACLPR